jgi:rod shape-determining protein MreC
MKPLFLHGPSPTIRVIVFGILSIMLMTVDHRWRYFDTLRGYLAFFVYPVRYLVDLPVSGAQHLSESLATRGRLLEENRILRQENLLLQVRQQRHDDLQRENGRLRELLNSARDISEQVLSAEVLAIDPEPFTRKMIINKGLYHDVVPGLPLLDAHGVLGQVVQVDMYSSTVTLITDPSHALPVRVERTGARAVVEGTGQDDLLSLLYLPNNAEIRAGDKLVTSGLGGKFPPGYPVGTVLEVTLNTGQPYAQALAKPSALLDRNQEILLVWPIDYYRQQQAAGNPLLHEVVGPPSPFTGDMRR